MTNCFDDIDTAMSSWITSIQETYLHFDVLAS